MNYYDIVGADAPPVAPASPPPAIKGPSTTLVDPLANAVAKRIPKAEMEALSKSLAPLLVIDTQDPVATSKSMIVMNEKMTEFALRYCKTPEECKAVVKESLKQFEGMDKDPSVTPEVKKLVKEMTERLNKRAAAGPQSFWTRPVLGPVPGWGVVAGGAGAAVGLGLLLKMMFGRR
jgi:hypothetical protein